MVFSGGLKGNIENTEVPSNYCTCLGDALKVCVVSQRITILGDTIL